MGTPSGIGSGHEAPSSGHGVGRGKPQGGCQHPPASGGSGRRGVQRKPQSRSVLSDIPGAAGILVTKYLWVITLFPRPGVLEKEEAPSGGGLGGPRCGLHLPA